MYHSTAGHLPPNDWICVPTSSYYVESISNFAVSQSVVRNHLCPQAYVLASAAERVNEILFYITSLSCNGAYKIEGSF